MVENLCSVGRKMRQSLQKGIYFGAKRMADVRRTDNALRMRESVECGAVPSAQGRSAYRWIYDIPDMASGQASFGALEDGGAAQPWDKKGVGKVETLRN